MFVAHYIILSRLVSVYNITHRPTYPPTHLPTYPPTHRPTDPPTHLPTYPPTHRPTYPPTHLPTDRPTHLPTYPPTYLPTHPPTLRFTAGQIKMCFDIDPSKIKWDGSIGQGTRLPRSLSSFLSSVTWAGGGGLEET